MIWIDLDNSPHVPLFAPIIRELNKKGIKTLVTARDFAQTEDLLNVYGINAYIIGFHGGKNKIIKIVNLFYRAIQLYKFVRKFPLKLAISHGSRTQLVTTKFIGVPSILMMDYEYTETRLFNYLSTYMLIPKHIPDSRLLSVGIYLRKTIRYNGFKEELYLNGFKPIQSFLNEINIDENQILIVIRPPGMAGNYHDSNSEELLISGIKYFSSFENTVCLIINRTIIESDFITSKITPKENIRFLEKPVNGLQLIFAADIVVSGGGTMNREGGLIGTETYSIFTGKRPYLDEYLEKQGKLKFIEKPEDFYSIDVSKKKKSLDFHSSNSLVHEITDIIIDKEKNN